jgi:hypothetical protein
MQHGPRAVPQMYRTEGVPHQETDAERIGAVFRVSSADGRAAVSGVIAGVKNP